MNPKPLSIRSRAIVPVGIAVSSDDVTVRISGEAGQDESRHGAAPEHLGARPGRPGSRPAALS